MAEKTRVYLIFGGRSGEHEVSLMSARNVLQAIDREQYEVVPVGITREGRWLLTSNPVQALNEGVERAGGLPVALLGDPTRRSLVPIADGGAQALPTLAGAVTEVFFPVLHGPFGEDGTIQGLLEMAGVAYVGCGVLASSAGMDKAVAKALFRQAGLQVADYRVVLRRDWEHKPGAVIAGVEEQFSYPCFVKPANMGSSVGITKAHDRDELQLAFDQACRYDRRILVEEAINAREIEVSVLGNDDPIASLAGEVIPGKEFYDYDAKYFDDSSRLLIPAPISAEQMAAVRRMAVTAFRAIDGAGMARVDFFFDRDTGRFCTNEVNTIPGFTRISMYPKLWEASGIPYPELVNRLIALALERHQDKSRNSVDPR